MTSFAIAFARFRRSLGWTQKQVAEACEVDPNSVGLWERGRTVPGISSWRKLEALGFGVVSGSLVDDLTQGRISARHFLDEVKRDRGEVGSNGFKSY